MSTLVESARKALRLTDSLDERVAALDDAIAAGRGRLDEATVGAANEVVIRASERLRLSAQHTVVALGGATGSGKSSTFNAITGLELSSVGVRRPTTSWTTACVWGQQGAEELLDWLGIPPRHQVTRDSMLDSSRKNEQLEGLVLLDLPDHDSTEVSHHLEAERLVGLADLLIWVLDPQKYADAAIHDRFLKPMAAHKDSMLVILNHIDEVPPERREPMVSDVKKLLEADGLKGIRVIATSAVTGEGLDELANAIAKRVGEKESMRTRLSTDVRSAAEAMLTESGSTDPRKLRKLDHSEVVEAMADAAGVPVVVDAVRTAATMRARQATGWPVTAWLSKLRPDPLKRLHVELGKSDRDLVAAARSSMPPATKIQHARVESEVRRAADRASDGLALPWVRSVRSASTSRFDDLGDQLDRVITQTDLGMSRRPVWTQLVRFLQWAFLISALAGAAWLGVLAVMRLSVATRPDPPQYWGLPLPLLLLIGGVAAGVALAVLCRIFIAVGAKSKAQRARLALRNGIADVAEELVLGPIDDELDAYEAVYKGLSKARG